MPNMTVQPISLRFTLLLPLKLHADGHVVCQSLLHHTVAISRFYVCFQSDIANERSFSHALAGVELEEVRPNTAQIEPWLPLPW